MKKLIRKAVFLALATLSYMGVSAQTTTGYDLAMWWGDRLPGANVLTEQPVRFEVKNIGKPIKKFYAGVKKNNQLLFEEEVDSALETNEERVINLKGTVKMEYGEKASFVIYVRTEEKDDVPTNDTLRYNVTMPQMTVYPYQWTTDKAQDNFHPEMMWKYVEENQAFGVSGKATNWMGGLSTDGLPFPKDGFVTCSFDYASDVDVKLTVKADYGTVTDTLFDDILTKSAANFKAAQFSFHARGAATLSYTALLQGAWNAYGSFLIRNINFDDAQKDLTAEKILSPALLRIARNEEGYAVKVRYTNPSPFDIDNPTFGYQCGSQKVEEDYKGTLKAGQSTEYTFRQAMKADPTATTALLEVWCKAEGDNNTANDTLVADYSLYDAVDFPFTTTFDSGNEQWSTVDANNDAQTWAFGQVQTTGSVAYYPMLSNNADDYLVTPAIKMPQGTSRISFYYAGVNKNGGQELTVLMGTSPDPQSMKQVLFSQPITNIGWLNGYKLIELPTAGTYYFAFHTTGSGNQLVIDNVRIDKEEDLCMDKVNFDQASGYNKSTAKVTLSLVNHGITPQKDIKVRYYINQDSRPYAEETIDGEVAPGDTIAYTFNKTADISHTDSTYTLIGEIATVVGPDQVNDKILGQSLSNWANQQLPYLNTFSDDKRNEQWSYFNTSDQQATNGWNIQQSFQAYSAGNVLQHNGVVADGKQDWAFSECIEMPKGKYEVSFFYRTYINFNTPDFQQSFEMKMGTDRTPQGMTIDVAKFDNITVGRRHMKKFTGVVDIPQDGLYYIGFANTSKTKSGNTAIDDVEIKPLTQGQELPYQSDFEKADSTWTKYFTNSFDTHWEKFVDKEGNTVERVSRTTDDAAYSSGFEGVLASPKLHLKANKTVDITVEYALSSDSTNTQLNVYGSEVDNPDSFKVMTSLPIVPDSAYATTTYSFKTGGEDRDFFVALRTNSPEDMQGGYVYDARIKAVTVAYNDTEGIDETSDNKKINFEKRKGSLIVKSNNRLKEVAVYDTTGRKVMQAYCKDNQAIIDTSSWHGVYIVKAATKDGQRMEKIGF